SPYARESIWTAAWATLCPTVMSCSVRILAVEVPVTDHRAQPGRLVGRRFGDVEAADGPLASLVIAVQHVDHQCACLDARQHARPVPVVGLPDGRLPEACIAGRNVQVTCLRAEVIQVGTHQV